jgi:hypothetical protein
MSEAGVEARYMVGHSLYEKKQYERARGIFGMAAMFNTKSAKYLSACGLACFMCNDFVTASAFFKLAAAAGDDGPKTMLRLAECSIRTGRLGEAKHYVDGAVSVAKSDKYKDDKAVQKYAARAAMMSSAIAKQIAAGHGPIAEKQPKAETPKSEPNTEAQTKTESKAEETKSNG